MSLRGLDAGVAVLSPLCRASRPEEAGARDTIPDDPCASLVYANGFSAFVDKCETIKGIVVSAVNSPHDFLVIYQHHHFAVIASAPLDGVRLSVFQDYSLIHHLDDRRTV